MSRLVEARELRPRELYETPNGSVYTIAGVVEATGERQARLWCAHAPDEIVFDPPMVLLAPEQQVSIIQGYETRDHHHHAGYVEAVFAREMDRRHQAAMLQGEGKRQQTAAEERQRERESRPWWKKVMG